MILYHGTNRKILNLNVNSCLTADFQDAAVFASVKNGDLVYEFNVDDTEIERDMHTTDRNWFFTLKKLKPVNVHCI